MKKIIIWLIVAVLALSLVFAGCKKTDTTTVEAETASEQASSGETKGEKSEFTFIVSMYSTSTEPFFKNLVANFEKENPDIKVDLQVIGWDIINQKVSTLISTNQAPDLLNIDIYGSYIDDDLLMDVSEVISPELKAKFYESTYKGFEVEGILYNIPFIASIRSLFYNKDIFAEAGIADPPETWSELRQIAKTIKDKTGIDAYGIDMTEWEGEAAFSYFIYGNGGGWKKDGKWSLNSPENIEAIEFMNELINNDKVTNPKPTALTTTEIQKLFGAGSIAMSMGGNSWTEVIKQNAPELNYDFTPMPVNDGKPEVSVFMQDSLVVFKSAEDPQAIGKFLDYIYKDENYQEFVTTEASLPVTKSVGDAMSAQDPFIERFMQMMPNAKSWPFADSRFPEIKVATVKAVQKVILGESSVESALNDLQKFAEEN